MRIIGGLIVILALALSACASPRGQGAPRAVTFRGGAGIEFYDFGLNISHAGNAAAAPARDCSTDRYWCYAGVSVLIAPRRCDLLRRLIRSRADWRVSEEASARFLFLSERQLYFASGAGGPAARANAGFVYDIELGIVGVWRSRTPAGERLDAAAIEEIITGTKWLEAPRRLFPCARRS